MGAFDDFLAQARRGLATLSDAMGLLQQAREANERARHELAVATEGTGNAAMDASLARLKRVERAIDEAASHGAAGKADFAAYLTSICADGALGSSPRAADVDGADAKPAPVNTFRPGRFSPERAEEVRRIGWPKTADGRTRARGYLYGADGRKLFAAPLRATENGPASDTSDLKEPYRSDDRYKTRYHVEGHVAAHMRRNGITSAALYLNIDPCGSKDQNPYKCDPNIDKHLPVGSTLTVWAVYERGGVQRTVYEGTGEALQ